MATTKPKKKRELDLSKLLAAVDYRNYDFYNSLTEAQLKEFSPFVLMRYISNTNHRDFDVHEWYIDRLNERVNKNHWDLSKNHQELLWLLYASVGGGEPLYHEYLPGPKQETNKIEKLLAELNPAMKLNDIKLWASMMTDQDKSELFDKMGFDKKQRKAYE